MPKSERMENGVIGVLAMTIAVACCAVATTANTQELSISDEYKKTSRAAPGEIIVEVKRGVIELGEAKGIVPKEKVSIKSESMNALNKKYGFISIEKLFSGTRKDEPSDLYVFRFPKDANADELISVYKKDKDVLYVEANYTVHSGPSF